MTEAKPLATLSSSLLARKGHAKPAMRPQAYSFSSVDLGASQSDAAHDDLGWNDMGEDHGAVVPLNAHNSAHEMPTAPPLVVRQHEKLIEEYTPLTLKAPAPAPVPSVAPAPAVRAAPGSKGKSAFTLRLDGERHLRLRLICAVRHRSAQQIVTQALDEFLDRQPDDSRLNTKR